MDRFAETMKLPIRSIYKSQTKITGNKENYTRNNSSIDFRRIFFYISCV